MMQRMSREQIVQHAAAVHRANQIVLRQTGRRRAGLERAARDSARIVERALRQLRTGA